MEKQKTGHQLDEGLSVLSTGKGKKGRDARVAAGRRAGRLVTGVRRGDGDLCRADGRQECSVKDAGDGEVDGFRFIKLCLRCCREC